MSHIVTFALIVTAIISAWELYLAAKTKFVRGDDDAGMPERIHLYRQPILFWMQVIFYTMTLTVSVAMLTGLLPYSLNQ